LIIAVREVRPVARTSPTFRRRRLARRIRRLREQAGLAQERAAEGLDMSTSALSRKENGEVATSVHEARSMMETSTTSTTPTCSTSPAPQGKRAGGAPTASRIGDTSTSKRKPAR
jgi:ribosome-binding protein aMBF1 (putative translation factor)